MEEIGMFEASSRRHPVQTFQFWFIVLASFVAVSAWKLDFFTPSQPELPVVSDESMPPPPTGTDDLAGLPASESAPPQTEEPEKEFSLHPRRIIRQQSDSSPVREVGSTPTSSMEAPSVIRTAGLEMPSEPPKVMQAVAEEVASLPEQKVLSPSISPQSISTPQGSSPQGSSAPSSSPASLEPSLEPLELEKVDHMIAAGEDVPALRLLSQWYWKRPASRSQFMGRLQVVSRRIYFASEPHYMQPHRVQFGEQLEQIAAKYQLSGEYLAKLNRIEGQQLRATQPLKVLQGPFSAVIDVSDFEITIHAQGYYIAHFKVGFGTDQSIPEGTFYITQKMTNPDYHSSHGVIPGSHSRNPLGSRWLTINDEQHSLTFYGLHGMTDSATLEAIEGPGCVRMNPGDINAVYDLLTVGSEIIIHP